MPSDTDILPTHTLTQALVKPHTDSSTLAHPNSSLTFSCPNERLICLFLYISGQSRFLPQLVCCSTLPLLLLLQYLKTSQHQQRHSQLTPTLTAIHVT